MLKMVLNLSNIYKNIISKLQNGHSEVPKNFMIEYIFDDSCKPMLWNYYNNMYHLSENNKEKKINHPTILANHIKKIPLKYYENSHYNCIFIGFTNIIQKVSNYLKIDKADESIVLFAYSLISDNYMVDINDIYKIKNVQFTTKKETDAYIDSLISDDNDCIGVFYSCLRALFVRSLPSSTRAILYI